MKKYLVFVLSLISFSAFTNESITWLKTGDDLSVNINWCVEKVDDHTVCEGSLGELVRPKIDTDTSVSIKVESFNFLKFNIGFNIEEQEIKAYSFLAGIWSDILGFNLDGAFGTSAGLSSDPLIDWWKNVINNLETLEITLANYNNEYLTKKELSDLEDDVNSIQTAINESIDLKSKAFRSISTDIAQIEAFQNVNIIHNQFLVSANRFISLANLSINGKIKSIGKKNAGVIVSVEIEPLSQGNEGIPITSKSVDVSYPVESVYPLEFHAGFTLSQLKNEEFESISQLNGSDLYARIRNDNNTSNFSAYLSYLFPNTKSIYATIGTDIEKPGDNLYIGVSKKFNEKWYLSVGGNYGLATEAQGEVTEVLNSGNTRTLYEIVREERDWGVFLAISYKVF